MNSRRPSRRQERGKREICRFHGTSCRLGFCCTFMAQNFYVKAERRRSGWRRKKRSNSKEKSSKLERLHHVGPSLIFGDGSLLDDLANMIDDLLPTELEPPELGDREGKDELPPPTAPFSFAPKSSDEDEEEAVHADVSEFEGDLRKAARRSVLPMSGITVIPEAEQDEQEFMLPDSKSPALGLSPVHETPDDDNQSTSGAGSIEIMKKEHRLWGVSKSSASHRNHRHQSFQQYLQFRKHTAVSVPSTSGDEGDVDTECEHSFVRPRREWWSGCKGRGGRAASPGRKSTGSGVSDSFPDCLSDASHSSVNTTGSLGTVSSSASLAQPANPLATLAPGRNKRKKRGGVGAGTRLAKGKGKGKGKGIGKAGNIGKISGSNSGHSSSAMGIAMTMGMNMFMGSTEGPAREGTREAIAAITASSASATASNHDHGLRRHHRRPPPHAPTTRTRAPPSTCNRHMPQNQISPSHVTSRFYEYRKLRGGGGRQPPVSSDPSRPEIVNVEGIVPPSGQEEPPQRFQADRKGFRKSFMDVDETKSASTVMLSGIPGASEGGVIDEGELYQLGGRRRPKRRKMTVHELCSRLGKLEVQHRGHHSLKCSDNLSNFRELITSIPDLLGEEDSKGMRLEPDAVFQNRVEIQVHRPRINGESPSLGPGHAAVASPCGPMYMSPNGELTLLDITRASTCGSQWTRLPPLPVRSLHFSTASLINSTVTVFGGGTRSRKLFSDTYLFSLTHGRWVSLKTTGPPPSPRMHHCSVEVSGEYVLVHGGSASNHILSDLYRLHVRLGRWTRCRCRGARALAHHTANLYGRHIIIFGGTNGSEMFNSIFSVNLTTFTWTELPCCGNKPAPRMAHSSAILGDRMFIVGGYSPVASPRHTFNDIWSFHFPTRTWQCHPIHGIPRNFSSTLTFVHHTPSITPSAGHGIFTLLLAGVNPHHRKKGRGSNGGGDSTSKKKKGRKKNKERKVTAGPVNGSLLSTGGESGVRVPCRGGGNNGPRIADSGGSKGNNKRGFGGCTATNGGGGSVCYSSSPTDSNTKSKKRLKGTEKGMVGPPCSKKSNSGDQDGASFTALTIRC